MVLQAAEKLGTAIKNVTFGYNYVHQENQDFQVDRITYNILEMALHRARDFCRSSRPMLTLQELQTMTTDVIKFQSKSRLVEKQDWKNPQSDKWD